MSTKGKIVTGSIGVLVLLGLLTGDTLLTGDFPASLTKSSQSSSVATTLKSETVSSIASTIGYVTVSSTNERTILTQVSPLEISSLVLQKNNDRAGSISWIDTPDSPVIWSSLKDALLSSFTSQIHDVRDEQIPSNTGKKPISIITFKDPGLSEEQIAFVKKESKIYELHMKAGEEQSLASLLDLLP